jgi:hypothetical protein
MIEENPLRSWHLKQLERSLRGLATADAGQGALFPDWAVTPDELAFDFDHWASVVRTNYEGELSGPQAESLALIERKLSTMTREGAEFDLEVWTLPALRTSDHWADVRRLAASALEAFGWQDESTPAESE